MDYLKLIRVINEEFYELIPEQSQDVISFIEENPPLCFKSIGYAYVIEFLGFTIWCSEDDERPYEDEEKGIYMPLEKWLWQEITRILTLINQLGEILNKEKLTSF